MSSAPHSHIVISKLGDVFALINVPKSGFGSRLRSSMISEAKYKAHLRLVDATTDGIPNTIQ